MRVVVQLQRRANLRNAASVEHHDLVGQSHGLDLVVGDIDHRCLEALVQARDFDTHLHAEEGVQVGQRLVEQEHLGFANHGAPDRDALALAAGQVLGLALEQVVELEDLGNRLDTAIDFGLVDLCQLEAERHVFRDVHVRI